MKRTTKGAIIFVSLIAAALYLLYINLFNIPVNVSINGIQIWIVVLGFLGWSAYLHYDNSNYLRELENEIDALQSTAFTETPEFKEPTLEVKKEEIGNWRS